MHLKRLFTAYSSNRRSRHVWQFANYNTATKRIIKTDLKLKSVFALLFDWLFDYAATVGLHLVSERFKFGVEKSGDFGKVFGY